MCRCFKYVVNENFRFSFETIETNVRTNSATGRMPFRVGYTLIKEKEK